MNNKDTAYIGIVTALMAISAFIKIPIQPVPLTLQMLVVLLLPMVFGMKVSFLGILLYIILGLLGLPIFANGGGLSYVLQPTFGYIVGYLFSAIFIGFVSKRFKGFLGNFIGGLAGLFVIYILGVLYLYYNINFIQNKPFTFSTALKIGFFVPIGFDIIKLIVAALTATKIKKG